MIAEQLGNCAMFCRNTTQFVHADALTAEHLIVVGGPVIMHKNATYLSGNTAADTAILVANYTKSL